MRTYDEALKDARDESTFSNSSQWEVWSAKNCHRCFWDKPARQGDEPNGCPLILIALEGKRPAEWLTETAEQEVFADYTCTEFRGEDDGPGPEPRPFPTPPGQGELLPREPYEGHRMLIPLNPADRESADFRVSIEAGLTESFDSFSSRMGATDTTTRRT